MDENAAIEKGQKHAVTEKKMEVYAAIEKGQKKTQRSEKETEKWK